MLPGSPVPSSAGEESLMTKMRPVPKVLLAHMMLVLLPWLTLPRQMSGCAAVELVAMEAPLLNLSAVTAPCVPLRMGLAPARTLLLVSEKFVSSMLKPNGLACTPLLLIKSFQMAGES